MSTATSEASILRRRLEDVIPHIFARTAALIYRLSGDCHDWCPLLTRFSAHASVLTLALLAALLGSSLSWQAPAANLSLSAALPGSTTHEHPPAEATAAAPNGAQAMATAGHTGGHSGSTFTVSRLPNPHTVAPKRPRLAIITYTVEPGDTIQSIAEAFELEPTTIMWANPAVEDAPDMLRIGQQVVILPIDGVYHQVEEEDTLSSIAETYGVDEEAILSCRFNDLGKSGEGIRPGTALVVPGGEKPYEPKRVTAYAGPVPEGAQGTGRFQWPVRGTITQNYWYGHRALDVGAPTGSAVMAADAGLISFAGWTDVGYGYLIVIDHGNDFATYYAHLSNIYVAVGQAVSRGQVVGAAGNTGNSTGPHLHFEVRRYNTQQNPRAYLP